MAWCYYKDLRRKIGARLRVRGLPDAITRVVPIGMKLLTAEVDSRCQGVVVLQLWCQPLVDVGGKAARPDDTQVHGYYIVLIVSTLEDPNWIVER
jgi:hypothetical protein